MSEASVGHGGFFELTKESDETFKPNLEFTLPVEFIVPDATHQIRVDGNDRKSPKLRYREGIPSTHPNKIPNHVHDHLEIAKDHPEDSGTFETFNPASTKSPAYERIDYTIKYFDSASKTPTKIAITKDYEDDTEVIVQLTFSSQKKSYVAVVTYDFRPGDHPVMPNRYLTFSSRKGPVNLSVLCYVYIVLADEENPDPQTNGIASIKGDELYINATKLLTLMTKNPNSDAHQALKGAKLYYARTSEVNDLNISDWNINVTQVANQDTPQRNEEIEFTLTPQNFLSFSLDEGHIPFGLYIFGKPANEENKPTETNHTLASQVAQDGFSKELKTEVARLVQEELSNSGPIK